MPRLVLVSVYHCGTRFMLELLREFRFYNRGGGNAAQFHCLTEHLFGIRKNMANGQLVVPLRDPVSIFTSWRRRDRSVSYLRDQLDILTNAIHGMGPIYVPLDHPDREIQLAKVEEVFKVKLKTDWGPVGHRDAPAKLEGHFYQEALEWREVPPFRRYYADAGSVREVSAVGREDQDGKGGQDEVHADLRG